MRRHGAAGVEFGVDQRAQLHRRLDGRVEVEPEFAEDVQVRAESGAGNHDVGLQGAAVDGVRRVTRGRPRCLEGGDAEAGVQFDASGLDEPAQPGAELAAGGQPVGVAAAVDLLGGRAADGPQDPRVRVPPWPGRRG